MTNEVYAIFWMIVLGIGVIGFFYWAAWCLFSIATYVVAEVVDRALEWMGWM